jgi:hypothetical protein
MTTERPTAGEVVRWLDANGEAGYVECDPGGSPAYQVFAAQAGPVERGAPVCVLTQDRGEKIAHALRCAAEDAERAQEMREALAKIMCLASRAMEQGVPSTPREGVLVYDMVEVARRAFLGGTR